MVLIILIGVDPVTSAQSLVVSGSLFLSVDSIGFTYESPEYDTLDWIGIYHVDDAPGGPASVVWDYIPASSGTLYLQAPDEEGDYKAFLLCCDGYDTIAISEVFRIEVPVLTSSLPTYVQGDSMVFTFVSPRFSETDWIGIYPAGTKPADDNPSLLGSYIPDSSGTISYTADLDPGLYDAYLLCCDGFDSLAACSFEIVSADVPFVTPASNSFTAGSPIEISYNDPDFAEDDWIGIYFEGDDPALVSSVVWTTVPSQTGLVSFPGTLSGGSYFAVLFCCGTSDTEYARSDVFVVQAGAAGTYVKTAASVYPEGISILVNYRDMDYADTDWIGIYKKGESPGGPEATLWVYAPSDSGTVEFTDPLDAGDYVVYLLCCDGYNIKAKYDFAVADASVPSIVAASMTFATVDSLVFYFNSPNFVETDWIGIYNPGDVPGDIGSITWFYLPAATGTMVFRYPDNHMLQPGEYWAGLFCCDGYDLYAQTSFVVVEQSPTGVKPDRPEGKLTLFPNPSNGHVTVRTANGEKIRRITLYNLTGKVVLDQKLPAGMDERILDLSSMDKGIYFIEVLTRESKSSMKLIIQ